jgi:hypothetical protein
MPNRWNSYCFNKQEKEPIHFQKSALSKKQNKGKVMKKLFLTTLLLASTAFANGGSGDIGTGQNQFKKVEDIAKAKSIIDAVVDSLGRTPVSCAAPQKGTDFDNNKALLIYLSDLDLVKDASASKIGLPQAEVYLNNSTAVIKIVNTSTFNGEVLRKDALTILPSLDEKIVDSIYIEQTTPQRTNKGTLSEPKFESVPVYLNVFCTQFGK